MGSSDPVLSLLKSFGYNVVRLPRTNIKPLQILEKQGNDLTVLGDPSDLFIAGSTAAIPSVSADEQAVFIEGKRTRGLDVSVGLSLLGGIVGAMTGTKVKLDAAYKKAGSLVFEFEDVKMNNINQLALSRYLTAAKVDESVGFFARALEEDRLYIITSTLKSRKFVIEALQSNGASAAVDVPIIKQIVSGSLSVKKEGTSESKVSYQGTESLVFGFQAVRMIFEKGKFKGFKSVKSDEGGLRGVRAATDETEVELLEVESPFVNLSVTGEESNHGQ